MTQPEPEPEPAPEPAPVDNVTQEPEEPEITFDEIIAEAIPQSWMDQFDADFEIEFTVSGVLEFSETDKEEIVNGTYRSVYLVDRLDSYFTKPLPWTEGKRYYDWLKDTIAGISFTPDPNAVSYCCFNNMIILRGLEMRDNYRNLLYTLTTSTTPWYDYRAGMSAYDAGAATITHEARHNNGLNHADCNGFTNMDGTLQMVGSYGVNYMFVYWMEYMLPQVMVDEVIASYGHDKLFDGSLYISRMCTYNESSQELGEEDITWLDSCLTGTCAPS